MALLDPLLDLQDLDLQADRLRAQRESLPERDALKASATEIAANDRLQASTQDKRDGFARNEREVAGEVSVVAANAQDVEGRSARKFPFYRRKAAVQCGSFVVLDPKSHLQRFDVGEKALRVIR